MVEVQRQGNNAYQAIRYHENKVREGKAEILTSNIGYVNTQDASDQFEFFRTSSSRNIKDYIFHSSINLAIGENIPNEDFTKIGLEYVEKMGFSNSPFIIYRHHDEDHQHIHVVTTRYTFEKEKLVSDSKTKDRANEIISELEQKYKDQYNLRQVSNKAVQNKKRRNERTLPKEIGEPLTTVKDQYMRPLKPLKNQIASRVAYAFNKSDDLVKISAFLKRQGIKMKLNTNQGGIYGLSFAVDNPEIRKIPFATVPGNYFGNKLSNEQKANLQRGEDLVLSTDSTIFLSQTNMLLSRAVENQLQKAIQENQCYKGSQLHKQLSWGSLKGKLNIPTVQQEIATAERANSIADEYNSNDKLLVSYENRYFSGVLEALNEGRSMRNIASQTFGVGSDFWKKCEEAERKISHRMVASDIFKNATTILRNYSISDRLGFREEVVLAGFGIFLRPQGLEIQPNSILTQTERSAIINNKSYQFIIKGFNTFELTEGDKEFISAISEGNLQMAKSRLMRRNERDVLIATILFENIPTTRELIIKASSNLFRGSSEKPEVSWALTRLKNAIAKDLSNDLTDENDLTRN